MFQKDESMMKEEFCKVICMNFLLIKDNIQILHFLQNIHWKELGIPLKEVFYLKALQLWTILHMRIAFE